MNFSLFIFKIAFTWAKITDYPFEKIIGIRKPRIFFKMIVFPSSFYEKATFFLEFDNFPLFGTQIFPSFDS